MSTSRPQSKLSSKERLQQQAAAKAQLAELAAKREAEFRTDAQLAQEIYAQIARDAEKQRLERQRIMQDLQARIFALDEDVARRVAKKPAKNAFNDTDKGYIREE